MSNVKYYCRKADELRLLAGRMEKRQLNISRDKLLLFECANIIGKLAQVEALVIDEGVMKAGDLMEILYPRDEDYD